MIIWIICVFLIYIYKSICVCVKVCMSCIYFFFISGSLFIYIQYDYRISCHACSITRVHFCDGSPRSRHQTSTKELLKLSNSELTLKCLKRPCFENSLWLSPNADQLDELKLFDHKVAGLICFLSGTWKLDSRFQAPSTFYSFVFAGLVRFR